LVYEANIARFQVFNLHEVQDFSLTPDKSLMEMHNVECEFSCPSPGKILILRFQLSAAC